MESLQSCRAQLQQVIHLARINPDKQVIFKPTSPGLGVFSNQPVNVAKGFYIAAEEFKDELRDLGIQVRFQVYYGTGRAKDMADILGLKEYKSEATSD